MGGKVEGSTKVEKLPFLLEKDLGIKVNDLLNYFPYLYGPYSSKDMHVIYRLAYFKLITIEEKVLGVGNEDKIHHERVYELTSEDEESPKLFKKLPNEHKNALPI